MKTAVLTIYVLFCLGLAGKADAGPVWDFSGLQITDGSGLSIQADDCQQITVTRNLSLPARTVLIQVPADWPSSVTTWHPVEAPVSLKVRASDFDPTLAVTSETGAYREIVDAAQTARLGSRPVELLGRVTRNGREYVELMLFPVTIDSNGWLYLHRDIEFLIAGSPVDESACFDRADFEADQDIPLGHPTGLFGSDYLVITSASLAAATQPLVTYKNQTGYRTELVLIENILSSGTGIDDAEKLRNYLKLRHNDGIRYVLLAGDETIVPIRYAYHTSTVTQPVLAALQICDLYFADLTGDWDSDGDNVWGEAYSDNADLTPELLLGRLPVSTATEISNYVAKLIRYETDPGSGDLSYLERSFFFSSDQMRDYGDGGQHHAIAGSFPGHFQIDTTSGVEVSDGDDPAPSNLSPDDLATVLDDGFGIINVIAHGRSDGFVLKSAGYNDWPKTYMLTDNGDGGHGSFSSFDQSDRPAFYYSLACDNGGFDMDQPPFNHAEPIMAQELIGAPGGAVAMVAYSRWGWIGSSYILQRAYFDSLFAHPERTAVEANNASKATLYYYRDLVYGLNYFGDPTLKLYTRQPDRLELGIKPTVQGFEIRVSVFETPVPDCSVTLSDNGFVLGRYVTDPEGVALIDYPVSDDVEYTLTAAATSALVKQVDFVPTLITDVEDEGSGELPDRFALHANYPNPFNPSTSIAFDLPRRAEVTLTIYNLLGQTVTVLANEEYPAGRHEIEWDGRNGDNMSVASGIYFYRLQTTKYSDIKKMVLVK